jgi:hypothetical protein
MTLGFRESLFALLATQDLRKTSVKVIKQMLQDKREVTEDQKDEIKPLIEEYLKGNEKLEQLKKLVALIKPSPAFYKGIDKKILFERGDIQGYLQNYREAILTLSREKKIISPESKDLPTEKDIKKWRTRKELDDILADDIGLTSKKRRTCTENDGFMSLPIN